MPSSFPRTGGAWKVSSYSNDFSLISESLSVSWLIISSLIHFVQRDSSKTNKEMKFVSSFPSKYCFSCSISEAEEKKKQVLLWYCQGPEDIRMWLVNRDSKEDKNPQSSFLTVSKWIALPVSLPSNTTLWAAGLVAPSHPALLLLSQGQRTAN